MRVVAFTQATHSYYRFVKQLAASLDEFLAGRLNARPVLPFWSLGGRDGGEGGGGGPVYVAVGEGARTRAWWRVPSACIEQPSQPGIVRAVQLAADLWPPSSTSSLPRFCALMRAG